MDVAGRILGPSFDLEIERGILQSDILIAASLPVA
jgi:hypothetical protein